jgi:hypothetical protein
VVGCHANVVAVEAPTQLSSAAEGRVVCGGAPVLAFVGGAWATCRAKPGGGVEACARRGTWRVGELEIESGVGRVGVPCRLEPALCL